MSKLMILMPTSPQRREQVKHCLAHQAPELKWLDWNDEPKIEQLQQVEQVLAWEPPKNIYAQLPALKWVQSYGAGVDSILAAGPLPENVQLTRVIDGGLNERMGQFALAQVLADRFELHDHFGSQQQSQWHRREGHWGNRIGIVGLGSIGQALAKDFNRFGFQVSGWSRTPKRIPGVESLQGEAGLNQLLEHSDYLINLLPLTLDTENFFDAKRFAAMSPHSCFINLGRGAQVVDDDLIHALENHTLRKAVLDVFRYEPLPDTHPFWSLASQSTRLILTPHIANISVPERIVALTLNNLQRLNNQQPLLGLVDPALGY